MSKVCLIKSNEIVNGSGLMYHNLSLDTWDSDLDLLENGEQMFSWCYHLTAFSAKTPNLTNGRQMFYGVGHKQWSESTTRTIKMDFDSLTDGYEMFASCNYIELVSRTPLNYCFEFPSLTEGFRMFYNVTSVEVRSENDTECGMFHYLRFPSLVNATEMFAGINKEQNYYISLNTTDMFPVVTNFEKTFSDAHITYIDGELLTGKQWDSSMPPIELNCKSMFYASISDYVYVGLPSSLENSDIHIYADDMFRFCTGKCKAKSSFMNKVRSGNYMFVGACLRDGGRDGWDGSDKLLYANGMFMNANLEQQFYDMTLGSVTEIADFMRGSNVYEVENFYVNCLGSGMFRDCYNLTGAYIRIGSGFSSSACDLFRDCGELMSVKLEFSSPIPRYQNFSRMFSGCKYLGSAEIVGINGVLDFEYLTMATDMYKGCNNLRSYDIVSACASMSYLTDAACMFMGTRIENWPFMNNKHSGDLPNLRYGYFLAYDCTSMSLNFDNFGSSYFGSLENGMSMFAGATNATGRWKTKLPALVDGNIMFYGTGITSVYNPDVLSDAYNLGNELDFNSLEDAYGMFANCANLAWCYMDVASLDRAEGMFRNTSGLRFARLLNCTNLYTALAMFANSNVEHVRLHSSSNSYEKLWNCSRMFETNGNLSVEITSDSSGSIELFNECSEAYLMFAVNSWGVYKPDALNNFKILKVQGDIFTQGTPPLKYVTGMFEGRKIIDQQTATFIGGIAHYLNIASGSSATLGNVYIEDSNNLSWFDVWGQWRRGTEYEADFTSTSITYQTLSTTCRVGGNVDMTVFYPTPEQSSGYDIVEGSAYIPDASSWSTDNATIGAQVTSVHDGYAWDDNA